MHKIKLMLQNKAKVAKIAADPERDVFVWDTEFAGFGLKITPKDRRVFIVQYRNQDGRTKRVTLGKLGTLTYDRARELASETLLKVAAGSDPGAERRERRLRAGDTVAQFADRYLKEHAARHKKATSAAEDARMVETYVKPRLGNLPMRAVEKTDIRRLHADLHKTPYMANRVWALLSRMFNCAEEWGVRPEGSNPCRGITRYPEKSRVRYLSAEELGRLGSAITACLESADPEERISPTAALAVRLLVLTGCRLREILNLRWSEVDLKHGCLRLADSKTGRKTVVLPAPARALLAEAPQVEGLPWVLPGQRKGAPLTSLRPAWGRITAKAELPELRAHDLRHAFASVAAVGGESLLLIGAMLGHSELETTKKYAHLSVDPVRAAAERTAGTIAAAMGLPTEAEEPASSGEVVPMPKRGHGV